MRRKLEIGAMKQALLAALATLTLAVAGALGGPLAAAEKFIPQGHAYAPYENGLPPLNSDRDRINAQTDIYESQIYQQQYQQRLFESELRRFESHDFSRGPLWGPAY
jgi:hypothetical protein